MKVIFGTTGIVCDADKFSLGDVKTDDDTKGLLDEAGALLTARAEKNGGVLFSTEINEVLNKVFGADDGDFTTSNTSSPEEDFPEKKYLLNIEDDSVAKKVRLDQLQPGSMFNWLGNPTMVVVDRLGNRRFADLRVGYFQEFDDEHTLVRPLEATLTINK